MYIAVYNHLPSDFLERHRHSDLLSSKVAMATSSDSWMRGFNEALKLADEINTMVVETGFLAPSGPDIHQHFSTIRTKTLILGTRLDSLRSLLPKSHSKRPILRSLLSKLPRKQPVSDQEMHRRQDMLEKLRLANHTAYTLSVSNMANKEVLVDEDVEPADIMNTAIGLDNQSLLGFQQQIMEEQDVDLEKLGETLLNTKDILVAVGEELDLHKRRELDLHTRLLGSDLWPKTDVTFPALNSHVDSNKSRRLGVTRRRLVERAIESENDLLCLFLVVAVIIITVIALVLTKYL